MRNNASLVTSITAYSIMLSFPFPSFPQGRESRIFRFILDPCSPITNFEDKLHGDDEYDCMVHSIEWSIAKYMPGRREGLKIEFIRKTLLINTIYDAMLKDKERSERGQETYAEI
jgi:hypothetical protein